MFFSGQLACLKTVSGFNLERSEWSCLAEASLMMIFNNSAKFAWNLASWPLVFNSNMTRSLLLVPFISLPLLQFQPYLSLLQNFLGFLYLSKLFKLALAAWNFSQHPILAFGRFGYAFKSVLRTLFHF